MLQVPLYVVGTTEPMDVPTPIEASVYCEEQQAIVLHLLYKKNTSHPIPSSTCVLAVTSK
jgi:hypothetical protein